MLMKSFVVICLSLLFITFSFHALSTETSDISQWKKPTPIFKQEFDWLRLTSDEWLKGDIIAMYDEELEFDSDELGVLSFKWEDVAELRSKGYQSIRMDNGTIAEGYLAIKDGILTLVNKNQIGTRTFNLADLLSIASSEKNEWDLWDGSINLGATFSSGNAEQFDYTLTAEFKRRTSTSRYVTNYLANFARSENQETGEDEDTANSERLTSFYDWFFSKKMFFRVADIEYFSDEFQNIDYRINYGIALGYHLVETKDVTWDLIGGPSYQYTKFTEVETGEEDHADSSVILLGTILEYDITKDIDFTADYRVQFVSKESGSTLHHLKAALEVELANNFELDLTLYIDRTEDPQPDEEGILPEENDYRFVVSLGYDF
jgi:hypothetical protein